MPGASPVPSGLRVLNTTPSPASTTNGLASSPSRISPSSASPTPRGRIIHRSLSPTARTTQPGGGKPTTRSPIRPLSKARVPKGSPSLPVRAFDALTQSVLFVLGLAVLAIEFIYAQAHSVIAAASSQRQAARNTARSARSPRRYLQTKLDGVAVWPPIGLGWFATALHALQARCGLVVGRAVFAGLVLAVGPSYVAMVVGVSVPLAVVKALSRHGMAGMRRLASTGESRGRKVSRS